MDYTFDAASDGSRRNLTVGAITIVALFAMFVLAVLARKQTEVPFVVVAPVGTTITLDGEQPRALPQQPNSSDALASFYFMTEQGEHEVEFTQPGAAPRTQMVRVERSRLPVIFTLIRDSLHEMKGR